MKVIFIHPSNRYVPVTMWQLCSRPWRIYNSERQLFLSLYKYASSEHKVASMSITHDWVGLITCWANRINSKWYYVVPDWGSLWFLLLEASCHLKKAHSSGVERCQVDTERLCKIRDKRGDEKSDQLPVILLLSPDEALDMWVKPSWFLTSHSNCLSQHKVIPEKVGKIQNKFSHVIQK